MKLRAIFPSFEIPHEPIVVRDYAQAVEGMGYADLAVYEHVVGLDRARYPEFKGVFDHTAAFHEPFVLFGYLAGQTKTIGLSTCVLILPQRQTVLVAKQAAEVAKLSGGRFSLGVGLSTNAAEYAAMGKDYRNRGARLEEQVRLLRELWANDLVTFEGRWEQLDAVGINPRPASMIPIYFGGNSERAMRRAARLGDGWLPAHYAAEVVPLIDRMRHYLAEAGRDPSTFPIEAVVTFSKTTAGDRVRDARALIDAGVSGLTIETVWSGFEIPQQHLDALREIEREFGAA